MDIETIIGIVIGAFLVAAIIMEFKNKNKKGDLFTNIIIAVIGFGTSVYMLYSFFNGSKDENTGMFSSTKFFSEIDVYIYFIVILISIAFTAIFLTFYFKNKDLVEQNEDDETVDEEDEELSDEEIEEILEKENAEEDQEDSLDHEEKLDENESSQEKIDDKIVLESLTAQKPKVLKVNEEDFKFKEGATQVPTNQRNPFEKK